MARRQMVGAEGPVSVLLGLEGDREGAHRWMEQTLRDAEGAGSIWTGRAWAWRGQVLQNEKNYGAAGVAFEKALAIWGNDAATANAPEVARELRETGRRLVECRRSVR